MDYIILNKRQLCDFELITNGSFYPLKGFMNKNDYQSCIDFMMIKNGSFFPIPITLCINEEQKNKLSSKKQVILKDETGYNLGIMNISDENSIYTPDIKYECQKVFGVYDLNHPYIQILNEYQKNSD
jgi:sulfate adenylyltransferase